MLIDNQENTMLFLHILLQTQTMNCQEGVQIFFKKKGPMKNHPDPQFSN